MQGEQMCHLPVAYIDFLLRCVHYINLHSLAKHLLLNCIAHGCSRGLAILLKCVFINSSQPRWQM